MKNKPNIANKVSIVLACLFLTAGSLKAQGLTNQVLTLQVVELNKIDVVGAFIVNGVGPENFRPASPKNVKSVLVWTSNGDNKKIAVSRCGPSSDSLRVITEEVSVTAGAASKETWVSGNTSRDLIVRLSKSAGSCTIRMLPTSRDGKETSTVINNVTFTITSG